MSFFMSNENPSPELFPKRVGKYVFSESVSCSARKETPYAYAVYVDGEGKKAFAKLWVGNYRNFFFYHISNEILAYKMLWKFFDSNPEAFSKFPNIRIPKRLHSFVSKKKVFLLLEFVSGKNLFEFPVEKRREVHPLVFEYLSFLGSVMNVSENDFSIARRSFWYWLFVVPTIAILAMISYPQKSLLIFRCFLLCVKHSWSVSNPFQLRFAHRDMSEGNIFFDGEKIWILDFELSAITYPAFDEASFALKLWDTREEYDYFLASSWMESRFQNETFRKSFFSISIYLALYNLLLKRGRSFVKMFEFLEYVLSLDGKKYEKMSRAFSLKTFAVSRWRIFKNFIYSWWCFSDRKVEIFPYDPIVVKKIFTSLREDIQNMAPELPIHFLGSSSFGIAGMKDMDIFVEVPTLKMNHYLALFSNRFGDPIRQRKTFIEWNFDRFDWTIEMLLIDPKTEKFQEQMSVCEILRNDKDLLHEYEALKYSFQGKSLCGYGREKTKFFSRVMIENGGYLKEFK